MCGGPSPFSADIQIEMTPSILRWEFCPWSEKMVAQCKSGKGNIHFEKNLPD